MAETTPLRPEPAAPSQSELARVEREGELQMRRTRRTVWLSLLLGISVWLVLIVWAVLAPNLSDRAQLILGILVVTEAAAMGFLLAVYAHISQMRVLEHYLARLRELARWLQDASERDSLTGLYNHGYLLSRLQEEISLAQRHQRPLSVIILDLNEFKEVNDRHGHLVGDEVLQLIAATIHQQVRRHDIVARYGGDEFCLVLPETERAGAEGVVEKLHAAVAAPSERLERWTDGRIGFDCGIGTYPEDGATVHALIASADGQLYQEKQVQRLKRAQEAGTPPVTWTA